MLISKARLVLSQRVLNIKNNKNNAHTWRKRNSYFLLYEAEVDVVQLVSGPVFRTRMFAARKRFSSRRIRRIHIWRDLQWYLYYL